LITTGATRVNRNVERFTVEPFVYYNMADTYLCGARLNELAEAVQDYGAKVCVQFQLGYGRVTNPHSRIIVEPVAPSSQTCFFDQNVMARGLTMQEIRRLIKDFEVAADIVSGAGIDAIELNAHNGYFLDQFMSSLWNKRTDEYGGDLEGRLRFPLEIIEAIKRGAGADYPIIFKFALTHNFPGGREIEEGIEIVRRLEAAGISAIGVDAGSYETYHWAQPPVTQPPGCMVYLADMVKKVVNIPVIAIGKLGYPDLAERVLQEGKADFILMTRPLLADPEWPNKVKEGRQEDIRPCIGDHEGCIARLKSLKYTSCTVNPAAGMERQFELKPAERKKAVLVIGGGPGGMEAARASALRGHNVTLWEKSNALGGNLIPASVPDFKQDFKRLIIYLTTQIRKLGVAIELGKEATPEQVLEMKPDTVFIAAGSIPIIPKIPGIEKRNVITAIDVLLGKKATGESVVVVGGGLVGSEAAIFLAQKGKKVTIVEILDSIARTLWYGNRLHLLGLIADASVKVLTETNVLEIRDNSIITTDKRGKKNELQCDTVVLAVGSQPNTELEKALKDKLPEVYAIGDCVEPRKVINAMWEGFRIARLI
ncbi:FAD-dependent oxidoreductase, partial [Chloroflexota bacterium]